MIIHAKYIFQNTILIKHVYRNRLASVLPELALPSKLVPSENIVKELFTVDFAIQFGTNQERSRHFSM